MKTLKCHSILNVKALFSMILSFIFFTSMAQSSTVLKVSITTGGDDLRGGNSMFMTINYANGTTSTEYNLGGGFKNNSMVVKNLTVAALITNVTQIRSVVIRHDGSPRAGQPFDTYDNWDLQTLRISFSAGGKDVNIINESGNPLVRFTGQLRNKSFTPRVGSGDDEVLKTSKIKVFLTTGSDDLRGGNTAYVTVHFANGTTSSEYNLGGGFGQNTLNNKVIDLGRLISSVGDIKGISIRHDGSPRAGQPFDTYDNWDLQSLRVALIYSDGSERNVINNNGNPLVRFTGALRTKTWNR